MPAFVGLVDRVVPAGRNAQEVDALASRDRRYDQRLARNAGNNAEPAPTPEA